MATPTWTATSTNSTILTPDEVSLETLLPNPTHASTRMKATNAAADLSQIQCCIHVRWMRQGIRTRGTTLLESRAVWGDVSTKIAMRRGQTSSSIIQSLPQMDERKNAYHEPCKPFVCFRLRWHAHATCLHVDNGENGINTTGEAQIFAECVRGECLQTPEDAPVEL